MTPPKKSREETWQQMAAKGAVAFAMKSPMLATGIFLMLFTLALMFAPEIKEFLAGKFGIPISQSTRNQEEEMQKLDGLRQHGQKMDSILSDVADMKPKVDGLFERQNHIANVINSTPIGKQMLKQYAQLQRQLTPGI